MRVPIYSYVPVGFSYSLSTNNGSTKYSDKVSAYEDEYSFSSNGHVFIREGNSITFSLAGLVNNTELVVEFDSPVLAEYFATISYTNCNVRGCWGKVWVYSDENPMVCMNQEKHGTYGCPYVFHQMYRYRCDTRVAGGIARVKRIVMWSGCPWAYIFVLNLRVLGVYDGLSLSPKEAEYLNYPAMHYFSEPDVTAVCCNTSENVEFGSVKQIGGKDPFNFNSRGAVLRIYNGKYGISVLSSHGGGSSESRIDFDKVRKVQMFADMQYMVSRDVYAGGANIFFRGVNSPIYYIVKPFNFAYNSSQKVHLRGTTGSVRIVASLPNPSTLTVSGLLYLL